MAKMVDLKRTPAERKAEQAKYDKPGRIGGDDYGYGLTVRLDHEHLKKLGITKMPKAGDVVHLHSKAHVKSTSEHSEDGGDRKHMELELRHMSLGAQADDDNTGGDEGESHLAGAKSAMDAALGGGKKKGKAKGGFTPPEGDED
jgi:hypothetical protein